MPLAETGEEPDSRIAPFDTVSCRRFLAAVRQSHRETFLCICGSSYFPDQEDVQAVFCGYRSSM
jgi:hypothetical protein